MYLICYLDRGIISVAQPEIRQTFGLNLSQMGLVLAAFTWAYANRADSGRLAWRSLRTAHRSHRAALLDVDVSDHDGSGFGLGSLFVARFLLGIGEAGAFPVASRGMQLWFAPSERGRIQGVTHFFSRFAVAITPLTAGGLMVAYGWRTMFFVFGAIGFLWVLAFWWFYRERPEDHPHVNRSRARGDSRRRTGRLDQGAQRGAQDTPWRQILTSPNMWWIALGYCCFFFGTNFYLTWYPTYLREYRGLSVAALGLWDRFRCSRAWPVTSSAARYRTSCSSERGMQSSRGAASRRPGLYLPGYS
jgi:sugar phosphate permease